MDTEVHLHSFRNRATRLDLWTSCSSARGKKTVFWDILFACLVQVYVCGVCMCMSVCVWLCLFCLLCFSRGNFCKYVTQKNLNNCFKAIKNTVKIMLLGIAGWLKSERLLTDMYRGGEGKTVCKSCWNQDSNSRAKFLSGHGKESRISDVSDVLIFLGSTKLWKPSLWICC